ncbi:uncharacterized protein LOC123549946 isoform X2 [Mercenaria mercenaria]|uniref:uncharacterized protein LOC123549946 isoform X2 n=1 Tax=Mercenaria mercenaria TaxID=6596 RepID=UPI00234EF729|nr:uncharacterized protein LOC123549946 isoform X2 [Mercenaria mercenaria]
MFNASANCSRTSDKLEKKWFNMTAKHRNIYSDFVKDRALTGGGVCEKKLDYLTEAVMNVIGKDTVAVKGASNTSLDSSFYLLDKLVESNSSTCNCHTVLEKESVENLKKRKLILEIQYLEKKT